MRDTCIQDDRISRSLLDFFFEFLRPIYLLSYPVQSKVTTTTMPFSCSEGKSALHLNPSGRRQNAPEREDIQDF